MSSELGTQIAGLLAGYSAAELYASEVTDDVKSALGKFALFQALRAMGLELPIGGELTQVTITEAINRDLLGGQLDFKNLFDRNQVRSDMKRLAVEKAGQLYGYDGGAGVAGLRDKVIATVLADIREQAARGSGDYVAAAKYLESTGRLIQSVGQAQSNAPSDLSTKGEKNRARQARYRASHKRTWKAR